MDLAMMAVTERLAAEFSDKPSSEVIRVVTDCVDEFPDAGPMFVEEASRARLSAPESGPAGNGHG